MDGPTPSPHVLVVEDEYFIAAELSKILQRGGMTVMGPAATLIAADQLIDRQGLPKAAILDVNVAARSSYNLAAELVERNVPVMFVTGYDGWHLPEEFRAYPRITKPARPELLLATLVDIMEDSDADSTPTAS